MDQELANAPAPNNTQPFDEIALTFSGGGYRAAAFHLGTLDLLHRLDLLQSVHVLSTVSGGTLTGMKYAVSAAEGVSFEDFYREFSGFLSETNVIGKGLAGLHPPKTSPFADQLPSLIRSAAEVYTAPQMLGNKTFALLLNDRTSHIREASFNATEFRTANYFRFQRSASTRARIGNGNLVVKREVAEKIRLADIAAASSCFPSAFEPLRFPDDFVWPDKLEEVRATLGDAFTKSVPLMDGGIFDNQGVDSVVRAYERGDQQIGLLIVSDTTRRKPSLFEFSPEKTRGSLTLEAVVKLAWIVFVVACITGGVLVAAWIAAVAGDGPRLLHLFLYGVPLILSTFLAAALFWIRLQYQEGEKRVAELTSLELWPFVKHLTVPDLIGLISGRAKSLVVLTVSIFMKRVRAMVYRDIKVHPSYLNREVSNLIYDLDDLGKFPDDIVAQLAPTSELRNLAIRAESTKTTLWLDSPEELSDLIACGQATTCFNIMRYILHKRKNELSTSGSREEEVYNRALALWEVLKQDRYAFLRR